MRGSRSRVSMRRDVVRWVERFRQRRAGPDGSSSHRHDNRFRVDRVVPLGHEPSNGGHVHTGVVPSAAGELEQ